MALKGDHVYCSRLCDESFSQLDIGAALAWELVNIRRSLECSLRGSP